MSTNLIVRAASFAREAHESIDQRRTDGTPYFEHCRRVAEYVVDAFGVRDPAIIAAAYLHDTVEDTPVTLDQIRSEFGDEVADLVDQVTNKYSDALPHIEKMEAIRDHCSHISPKAKYIKLADRHDNFNDMKGWKPGRALRYSENTLVVLASLIPFPPEAVGTAYNLFQKAKVALGASELTEFGREALVRLEEPDVNPEG